MGEKAAGFAFKFINAESGRCLEVSPPGFLARAEILEHNDCDNFSTRQEWILTVVAQCHDGLCEPAEGETCEDCPECGPCSPPPPTCDPIQCSNSCGGPGECSGGECHCI